MLTLIAATLIANTTMDLPVGTTICASKSAAIEYVEAKAAADEHRLHWLSGSVCHAVTTDFRNQQVLDTGEGFAKIEWVYGRDRTERYVITI